jgi:hypothetical protein
MQGQRPASSHQVRPARFRHILVTVNHTKVWKTHLISPGIHHEALFSPQTNIDVILIHWISQHPLLQSARNTIKMDDAKIVSQIEPARNQSQSSNLEPSSFFPNADSPKNDLSS